MKSILILGTLALGSIALYSTPVLAQKAQATQAGPPGMVKVGGGRFNVGAKLKDIIELIDETQFRFLASEVPRHSVKLDDFYIMPTELTNEQFAKYVEATSSKPPQSWAEKALGDASYAYAERTGKARKEARDAGQPVPKIEPFDANEWWSRNWEDSKWEVPKGKLAHPVVFIDNEQALAYSRWAGLRLMSEEEFQAAGRGTNDREYSAKGTPTSKTVNSVDANRGGTAKVGSFEAGSSWLDKKGRIVDERNERNSAEVQPIFDLSGNVWEWTRSPFTAHPGFKPVQVMLKSNRTKKKDKLTPPFDPNNRAAVGGAFSTPLIATRLTTRRNSARWQATDNLGMRCTASAIPGQDVGETIMRDDLPVSKRPDDTAYEPLKITATDKWTYNEGTAGVPNYAVIEGYEYMAVIPAEKAGVNSLLLLKDRSHRAPIQIGAFSSTIPVLEPALDAGTYTFSWRAAGEFNVIDLPDAEEEEEVDPKEKKKRKRGKKADEGVLPEPEPEFPFDPMVDTMLIHNTDGELVTWMRVGLPDDSRSTPGKILMHEVDPAEAERAKTKAGMRVTFKMYVPAKKASKGFIFEIPMTVAPGAIDKTWRR